MESPTSTCKPSLLHKLEGSNNEINAAVVIPGTIMYYFLTVFKG